MSTRLQSLTVEQEFEPTESDFRICVPKTLVCIGTEENCQCFFVLFCFPEQEGLYLILNEMKDVM